MLSTFIASFMIYIFFRGHWFNINLGFFESGRVTLIEFVDLFDSMVTLIEISKKRSSLGLNVLSYVFKAAFLIPIIYAISVLWSIIIGPTRRWYKYNGFFIPYIAGYVIIFLVLVASYKYDYLTKEAITISYAPIIVFVSIIIHLLIIREIPLKEN
jgi:hypothetical protein